MERQVCLVTGAARGLGNEFCRAFMRSWVLYCSYCTGETVDALKRGCSSIALLDLKQSEAQRGAEELVEFAGTCLRLQSFCEDGFSGPQS